MILAKCDECGSGYRFQDDQAGRTVRCKNCGSDISVPRRRASNQRRQLGQVSQSSRRRSNASVGKSEDDENPGERSWYRNPKILIAGGVGSLIVLLVFLFTVSVVSNALQQHEVAQKDEAPSKPVEQPPPKPPVKTTPKDVVPKLWNVKPDPLLTPIEYSEGEIAIPLPAGSGDVLYPATPSAFVAIGTIPTELEVLDLRTLEPAGAVIMDSPHSNRCALSPDGRHLIVEGRSRASQPVLLELWSVVDGTKIREFSFPQFPSGQLVVAFPSPTRILLCQRVDDLAVRLTTVNIATGQVEKQFRLLIGFDEFAQSHTLSATGRYLAAFDIARLRLMVVDLEAGVLAGDAAIPATKTKKFSRCEGLAFSNDGAELCGLFDSPTGIELVNWRTTDGIMKLVVKYGRQDQRLNSLQKVAASQFRLQVLPNDVGWLLYGTKFIGRGRASAFVFPAPQNKADIPIRLLDGRRVLKVTDDKVELRSQRLLANNQEVNELLKEADLPPLTASIRHQAKTIEFNAKNVVWSVKPDPLPKSDEPLTSEPILLNGRTVKSVEFSQAMGTPRMVVMQGTQLCVHDLISGSFEQAIAIKKDSWLLAVSPSGRLAAVRTGLDHSRIDVFSLESGEHEFAFKPYERSGAAAFGNKNYQSQAISWAKFIDDEHILTRNLGHLVDKSKAEYSYVMWKVPECRAIFQLSHSSAIYYDRFVKLSPGRRYLAVGDGKRVQFVDSFSGQLLGTVNLPQHGLNPQGIAFHPDGDRLFARFHYVRPSTSGRIETGAVTWDVKNAKMLESFVAAALKSSAECQWCPSSKMVFLNNNSFAQLLDLKRRTVLWSYRFQGHPIESTPDDRKWFHDALPRSHGYRCVVAPIKLQHETAEKLAAKKMPNGAIKLMGTKTKVSLRISGIVGASPEEVRGWLTKRLKEQGVSVANGQSMILRAEMVAVSNEVMIFDESDSVIRFPFSSKKSKGNQIRVNAIEYKVRLFLEDTQGTIYWEKSQQLGSAPSGGKIPISENPSAFLHKQGMTVLRKKVERFVSTVLTPNSLYFQPMTNKLNGFGESTLVPILQEVTSLDGVEGTFVKLPEVAYSNRTRGPQLKPPSPFDLLCREYVNQAYTDLLGQRDWQSKMKWCAALQRPVMGLR